MKTVAILGRDLVLSPRKAKDVMALAEAASTTTQDGISGMLFAAQVVNDSLKATYQNMMVGFESLSLLKKWKKVKETKNYAVFYKNGIPLLLDNLSGEELTEACNAVIELEGGKKKVVPEKESQSEEMLQEDLSLSTSGLHSI